jgi:diguanylate cyclase (GGDEF)-like protein
MLVQLSATRRHYVAAAIAAASLLCVAILAWPSAKVQCTVVQAFMPVFGTWTVLTEGLTAFLLWTQFRVSGLAFWARMAGAYAFAAVTAAIHLMVYPDVFSSHGLFDAGRQSAIWTWFLWRCGYALLVVLAITRRSSRPIDSYADRKWHGTAVIVAPVVISIALCAAAISAHGWLPDLVSGSRPGRHLSLGPISISVAVFCAAALGYHVAVTRLRTAVDLFLAVALLAGLVDVVLTLAAGPRYSVGWYAARVASMVSAGALLGVLQYETSSAYQALADAHCALKELSVRDALTGVFNRAYFDERFPRAVAVASESGTPLSVLLVDVDHFKAYNDERGHLAGDACLRQVAQTLQQKLQHPGGFVARYGGEEFAIVLPRCEPRAGMLVAERLRKAVSETSLPAAATGQSYGGRVTVSVGHASSQSQSDPEPSTLLSSADGALYRAKTLGRNRVEDEVMNEELRLTGEELGGQ